MGQKCWLPLRHGVLCPAGFDYLALCFQLQAPVCASEAAVFILLAFDSWKNYDSFEKLTRKSFMLYLSI